MTNNNLKYNIQSTSLRGNFMSDIVKRTIAEIHDAIVPMFGPGASDSFIVKDGSPYYTRDGKEILQTLTFDNELSNHIHVIMFQAIWRQGEDIGDGSTTAAVLLTNTCRNIIDNIQTQIGFSEPITLLRTVWNMVVADVCAELKKRATPLSDEDIVPMLYTITQDMDLSVKLDSQIHDAIMNQAYIIPRRSNIADDIAITPHMNPLIPATKMFSLKPVKAEEENTVIYHCNGSLDISDVETILSLIGRSACKTKSGLDANGNPITENIKLSMTIMILCNGITDVTRNTLKKLPGVIRDIGWQLDDINNFAVYTLNGYRGMTEAAIEDLSTIITDEPGIGGLVNHMTFEAYMLNAMAQNPLSDDHPLNTFDVDPHITTKIRDMFTAPYTVQFDDVAGIRMVKDLGPVATARYKELLKEISEEKSPIRKVDLNKRLRTSYGHFIELEVGSTLVKDGQRKYELIVDAIRAAIEGVKYGVVKGNSILHVLDILYNMDTGHVDSKISTTYANIATMLRLSMAQTFVDMLSSAGIHEYAGIIETRNLYRPNTNNATSPNLSADISEYLELCGKVNDLCEKIYSTDIAAFNLNIMQDPTRVADCLPPKDIIKSPENPIVEPVHVMQSILESSTLALEIATTKAFHISGKNGMMGNYIK